MKTPRGGVGKTSPAVVLALLAACVIGLPGLATALEIRQIPVTANGIVYDPVSRKLYVSVPGNATAYANSIAVIDPEIGTVENSVWVGSEPNVLALSDDGEYLYVGLDGAAAIRRVHLPTLTAGLQFGFGSCDFGPCLAASIAVMPGAPRSVAVVRKSSSSYGDSSVAIYDDGLPRPAALAGSSSPRALAFGPDGARLFGLNAYGEFCRVEVTPSGLSLVDATRGLIGGGAIHYSNGLVVSSSGAVVDPGTLRRLGQFSVQQAVAVDAAARVVFALGTMSGVETVRAFSLDGYTPLWALDELVGFGPIPSNRTDSLLRWPGGLVLRMDTGRVSIIDLSQSATLTLARTGTGAGDATATDLSMKCGADCVILLAEGSTVSLTATPRPGSTFAGWAGDPDCSDGVVTLAGPRSCVAVFQSLTSGLVANVALPANDLAYSAETGTLYASVPGSEPLRGNTVTEIDPSTAQIGRSVWVGSEPGRLAVSGDGRTLYVALSGSGAIRRVDLTTLTALDQFAVDQAPGAWASDLVVLPGDPDSVAVVRRGPSGWDPNVAVYTNGSRQPLTTPSNSVESLAQSASASRLYGVRFDDLVRMDVTDGGVRIADVGENLVGVSGTMIHFAGGRLFTDTGRVVDPEALAVLGAFPMSGLSATLVAPDLASNVVYAVGQDSSGLVARQYDPSVFTLRESVPLSGYLHGPASLRVAGPNRVAFRTETSVTLVSFGAPAFHTLLLASANPASGTTVDVSPPDVSGGGQGSTPFERTFPRGTSVTLTAAAAAGSNVFRYWERNRTWFSAARSILVAPTDGALFTAVYGAPSPSITAITPASGPVVGGTFVTITGANFVNGATVTFGGFESRHVVVVNATTVTAVSPTHSPGAVVVAVWNPDGLVELADGFRYTVPAADFDSDGTSEVLWRHATTDEIWTWSIDGTAVTAGRLMGAPAADWDVRGVGDYGGDGRSEILWRNRTTGELYLWMLKGTAVTETRIGTVDPAYDIVGNGDYNGDGRSDILWRHRAAGDVWLWQMNGSTVTSISYVAAPAPSYEVAGSGDFDDDGRTDVLWRRTTTGEVWIWSMDGAAATPSFVGSVSAAYEILGVGDFTGEGKADILWRHRTDGDVWTWRMDGSAVASENLVATVDPGYEVAAIGDFEGGAQAEVLWRHAARGEVWLWQMDGAAVSETFLGTVPLVYEVQSPR